MPLKFDPKYGRQYLEFDPLQLSKEVDGGWRVPSTMTFLVNLFRQWRFKIYWSTLYHKNMFVAYGKEQLLKDYLETFCKNVEKSDFFESVDVAFYDFSRSQQDLGYELDQKFKFFVYHPYENKFSHFVKELISYRDFLRNEAKKRNYLELPNKKLQFLFVLFNDDMVRQVNDSIVLFQELKDLVEDSVKDRLYFVPVVKDCSNFSPEFVKLFDFAAFLGDVNEKAVKEIFYPESPTTSYSFAQEIIGLVHTARTPYYLFVAHPFKKTFTNEFKKKVAREKAEVDAYNRYLEELDKVRNKNGY